MGDERDRGEWFDLAEDFNLISRCVDRGIYKAIRYQQHEYEHLRDDAIEEMERVRSMADETLERYRDTDD